MKANDYKIAMCKLIQASTEVLMRHLLDPHSIQLSGYFDVNHRHEEVDIAKSVSIHFYKAWFTEPHDFELMANKYQETLVSFDVTETSFIDCMIHVAKDMEDPTKWNIEKYPLIIFEDLDHTRPVRVDITKRK